MTAASAQGAIVADIQQVSLKYGKTQALKEISLSLPAGCMMGLIGPDGVGKSSLLALLAGAKVVQQGRLMVLGGDIADAKHRRKVCPHIAYMPQGLGKTCPNPFRLKKTCSLSRVCLDIMLLKAGNVLMH